MRTFMVAWLRELAGGQEREPWGAAAAARGLGFWAREYRSDMGGVCIRVGGVAGRWDARSGSSGAAARLD